MNEKEYQKNKEAIERTAKRLKDSSSNSFDECRRRVVEAIKKSK
jgi:hypothetical protein|tara:strand:- start:126 stop:257 length:132 start_codon:yes stop_codon:yes gene_type:complete